MTEIGTFEKIIQATASKLEKGERLTQAEIAMLAGYANCAAEAMPIMRQTIRTQDQMIDGLRATISIMRGEVRAFPAEPEDQE